MTIDLTPADQGTIAVVIDDACNRGLGDDSTVDQVYFALTFECGLSRSDAEYHAYKAVYGEAA
jgi:hypothetical protein